MLLGALAYVLDERELVVCDSLRPRILSELAAHRVETGLDRLK